MNRLLKLAGILKEGSNATRRVINENKYDDLSLMLDDIEVLIKDFKRKKVELDKKKKQLADSIFTKEAAKKIAEKHFVGKSIEQLDTSLLSGPGYGEIIKSIKDADFAGPVTGDPHDSLGFVVTFKTEKGDTFTHDFEPSNLWF